MNLKLTELYLGAAKPSPVGTAKAIPGAGESVAIMSVGAWVAGAGNVFSATVQHSADAVTWFDVRSFANQGAAGIQMIPLTPSSNVPFLLDYVRFIGQSQGATFGASVLAQVCSRRGDF